MQVTVLLLLVIGLTGCDVENRVSQALKTPVPEADAVQFWGDSNTAKYADQIVQKNIALADDPEVLYAWKQGIVTAVLQDEVNAKVDIDIDSEEVETTAAKLRFAATGGVIKFSGLSFYLLKGVTDPEEKLGVAKAFATRARSELIESPTQEKLRELSETFRDEVPDGLGVALKIDGEVPKKSANNDAGELSKTLARYKDGDVPPPVQTGATWLVVLHEGETAGGFDESEIKTQAVENVTTQARSEKYLEFMKEIYGPTRVVFHPDVIADDTKGTQ